MKPFETLTYLGQVRRLGRMARTALERYGQAEAKLRLIQHGENTTFRVDMPGAAPGQATKGVYVERRFLLRVHRPGYQTTESIVSELAWLAALRREAALPVPDPVPALDGALLVQVSAPGIPEPRNCSLLRWLNGRKARQRIQLNHFRALGQLIAQLHQHAVNWEPPPDFTRRRWDWEGLFGDNAGFNLSGEEVWALLPRSYNALFKPVADQMRQAMETLGQNGDAFGLIHADLFLGGDGNVLFHSGEARPIDFDDCGYGYWIYDLATALAHWQLSNAWPGVRDALLDGYTEMRPVRENQLAYLDLFMAARHVMEILWAVDMARINPGLRGALDGWMEWAAEHVRHYVVSSRRGTSGPKRRRIRGF